MTTRIDIGWVTMIILAAAQAAMRTFLGLGGAGAFGTVLRDQIMVMVEAPVDGMVIVAPFFLLGLMGGAAAIGLALRAPWGYHGTVAVSVATIAYDLWAAVAVQPSAAIGLVVPAIMLLYLYPRKERYLTPRAVSS